MRSVAGLRDCFDIAREAFTILMLSVLLLVTGCGSSDYTPRAALAPPPPFMNGVQSFGPPVPVEIAMVQMMDFIMPSAGADLAAPDFSEALAERKCLIGSSFTQDEGRVGFGFGGPVSHDSEHRFSGLHTGGQMTVRLTFALPSPVKKTVSCP